MSLYGFLAAAASMIIIFVGLPAQIYKNYTRKSCVGLDPSLVLSVVVAYGLWSLYGWKKPDYFLAISQTPGLILGLVILFQMIYYRNK